MSLRKRAVSGVKWTATSAAMTTGLRVLQLVVLARLLIPSDFGLIAMITVVIGFAQAVADMGISNAIIHRQDNTPSELSSLYWLNILAGLSIFALVLVSSSLVGRFYGEPRLASLIPWAALVFLVMPLGQQFQVLLQKELRFDQLAKVEMASTGIGTVIAISSAVFAQGVFSLIWGQLAEVSTKTLYFLGSGWAIWRPGLHLRWNDAKAYVAFGLYQMGERCLNYISANADYLIIGRFLGPETLGIYLLAYQLVTMPLARINPILTRVAFPVFAKKQTDNVALRRGYLEMIKLLALIVFPLLIGLITTAPLLVPVVFGVGWSTAIPLIQILAVLGLFKALANPIGSILLTKGRPDIAFKWNASGAVITVLVFGFFVRYGVRGVAWSYVGLSSVDFLVTILMLSYLIGLDYRDHVGALLAPLALSGLMGTTVLVGSSFLPKFVPNRSTLLLCLIAIGVTVYSSVALLRWDYLRELWIVLLKGREDLV